MKRATILILALIIYSNIQAQKTIYLDENGSKISETEFQNKWHNEELFLSRWDSLGSGKKQYARLKKDLYLKGNFNYTEIKKNLEQLINRSIPDSIYILIEYYYKDDLCTPTWDNKWTTNDILDRKEFLDPIHSALENNNIIFIALFEKGIILNNSANDDSEYFYSDYTNYFKEKLFKNPTLCGSEAIIKPNGQTLIRNGEFRADWMAAHLKPEIWHRFFETDN
jgi:hypothetical protein